MGVHDVLGKRLEEDIIMGGKRSDGTIERDALQRIATSLEKISTSLNNIEEILVSINKTMRLR